MKRLLAALPILIAVPALLPAPVALAAEPGQSMAATSRLNVRSGPGLDHQVLDTLFKGERVLVTQCRADWCQITHVGIDGWVYAPYLVAATFSETWRATSRDPPATRPNDNETELDLGAVVDVEASPKRCPPSHPFC